MKKINNLVFVTVSVFATACILLLINYVAVTCCIGNLQLFTALVLVVPIICIVAVSFIIGYRIKWNWKYGICIALILTLISWGTSQLIVLMAGNDLDSIGEIELQDNSQNASNDELMDELYDELDKKAYEYMLEQGLISEGEEIFGGDKTVDGKDSDGNTGNSIVNQNEIASTEMYIGIQMSDPVTELIGNIITFLVAYGLIFVGYKAKSKKGMQEKKTNLCLREAIDNAVENEKLICKIICRTMSLLHSVKRKRCCMVELFSYIYGTVALRKSELPFLVGEFNTK